MRCAKPVKNKRSVLPAFIFEARRGEEEKNRSRRGWRRRRRRKRRKEEKVCEIVGEGNIDMYHISC